MFCSNNSNGYFRQIVFIRRRLCFRRKTFLNINAGFAEKTFPCISTGFEEKQFILNTHINCHSKTFHNNTELSPCDYGVRIYSDAAKNNNYQLCNLVLNSMLNHFFPKEKQTKHLKILKTKYRSYL